MGSFFYSMHFKTTDAETLRVSADAIISAAKGHMYIAEPVKGWISAYPSDEVQDPNIARKIAAKAKVEHAIAFNVHDSDILSYWYFHDGKLADYYTSCPDYFGKATKTDMAAKGNAKAFAGLLDKPSQTRLAKLIGRRSIGDGTVGSGPEFVIADERLGKIAKVLKIKGVLGSYDYLERGESVEDSGATAKDMTAIGKPARKARSTAGRSRVLSAGETVNESGITFHLNAMAFRSDGVGGIVQVHDPENPPVTVFVPTEPTRSRKKTGRPGQGRKITKKTR